MTPGVYGEHAFEDRVEWELLGRGWEAGQPTLGFDAELGLDTAELVRFIGATQQKSWDRLVELYGSKELAHGQFCQRVAAQIDERGVLDVLRQGVRDRGVQIELAYFRPGHTLAVDALQEYDANVLTVARQLRFSARNPQESVDLALFVNGLPVASIELKNGMTGQSAEDAVAQYRRRDPKELFFAKRALVHFAVDPDKAFVATRLTGPDTRFLPFNLGTNGPGESGAAGNPPAPEGSYRVSYLWEEIWNRHNWLEMLQRFVHVDTKEQKKGSKRRVHELGRIFPRYHQWHAVQTMVRHAREHGAGQNYLVQHSAGSGKSNTIAWLAHRLSTLFDANNRKVFDKIVVITDRLVLDQQLQDTIYQFDHTPGVVKKIEVDSGQLAAALSDSTSQIIISTLEKYPFILDKVAGKGLGSKRYAVVIDEAHTSQTGEQAAKLKQAIGSKSEREPDELEATYLTRVRGKQPNLSYFAFTATPTSATLKLFGTLDPDHLDEDGEPLYAPFHVYSMQQAIEEGYILDVLANYLTYDAMWLLSSAAVEQQDSEISNPEVEKKKARRKLVQLVEAHPESAAQKAKLIVEDFEANITGRLGGRAKAMVVTDSRQKALNLYQAIRRYVDDRGLANCRPLVAFSGSLTDEESGHEFTESKINGFPESRLPDRFAYTKADDSDAAARNQEEYRILVVADKYQTGFDQPLLCAMYVDKPLTGVAAVQTLSRLNRTHPLKSQDDVRIVDFVNAAEDIQNSFKPWFESTLTEQPDANLLYRKQHEVMDFQVLNVSEMEAFMRVLGSAIPDRMPGAAEKKLHAELHRLLGPAVDRFTALATVAEREEFRDALQKYCRAYSLLAQVIDWGDATLERLYQYGRILLRRLPGRAATAVDIGDADLSHYRLDFTGHHDVSLSPSGEQIVRGHAADGGGYVEPEVVRLADVISDLNKRFGLDLGTSDQILFYQQVAGLVENTQMQQVALMNDEARFGQVVDGRLDDIVAENASKNEDFMKLYFDNPDFQQAVKEAARQRAYRIITDPARDEALARLRAEMLRETT
ncbi:type I restriction enzyme, R subunit [Frankia sp. AiPs1]|uniref:type I restriction endonuclease subunit R n=1 Tax=Frankia sp. AiPa1 TaxID=573492 RepID=UPI00202B5097|nr:DEAD/DEAH box helicase family protein [Frankia sp. AiPa1]MCL9762813.1 DEAD/DEAH box helicase family protein [Frankia sp. AiPa1]